MAIHTLKKSQILRATLSQCWSFFSDPRNLARITPPALDFRVLSELPAQMHPGLLIEYRVRPLLGLPVKWLTEITQVQAPNYFVDEQRVGPYRIWHHEHFFLERGDGMVEIRDRVTYVLPFGLFGELAHGPIVRPQLRKIFAYREKVVAEIFEAGRLKVG